MLETLPLPFGVCMKMDRVWNWIITAYDCSYFADSANEGQAQDSQSKLKRARLADDLNEKIALRPGPLELVEKNIIAVDSTVKEAALKGTRKRKVVVGESFLY